MMQILTASEEIIRLKNHIKTLIPDPSVLAEKQEKVAKKKKRVTQRRRTYSFLNIAVGNTATTQTAYFTFSIRTASYNEKGFAFCVERYFRCESITTVKVSKRI